MERLEKKVPSVALTAEQKAQIAEIESTFKARIAERELFLKEQISKAQTAGNLEEIADIWIRRTRISIIVYLVGGALLLFGVNFALEIVGSHTMALPRGQLALALLIFGLEMHHVLYRLFP